MYVMDQIKAWRVLLGKIIADPHEQQRIANALGINPATLDRWANDESNNPRPQNLRRLVRALPGQREELLPLILLEFPELEVDAFEETDRDDTSSMIPSEFYMRVIEACAKTGKSQRFWAVSNLVLGQALGQLDPNNLGMAITVAQCMPPSQGAVVRSLREVVGRGTPPWQPTLTRESLFLGVESLAGYVVTKGRPVTIENRSDRLGFYPVRWEEWEESASVAPIWFEERLAGCLLASSTQPKYFLPFRQTLVERYAQLMMLAFNPEDFYAQRDIQLLLMPDREAQRQRAVNFRQRISDILIEAVNKHETISIEDAERMVWQQLEAELLLA
jgi:transcriptional regulator with XRE-family HTH domain